MAQSGIFNILPTDYQLYLESMLPYMNEVPIGREYFDKGMEDQIIDSTLTDYWGGNTGSIGERDYITDKYRMGTNDPSTGTGFNKLFNTLGSYNYKINPPAAGADPSVTITDRYDWNPTYNKYGYDDNVLMDLGTFSNFNQGIKQEPVRSDTGDVTAPMFAKFLWNTRPTSLGGSGFDFANTAEMAGNYFGHRQSEGKGRDVNMTIPINNETFRNYESGNFSNLSEPRRPAPSNQPPRGAAGFNSGGIASFVI